MSQQCPYYNTVVQLCISKQNKRENSDSNQIYFLTFEKNYMQKNEQITVMLLGIQQQTYKDYFLNK